MTVDLFLQDKRLISVKRASQETGYSQDYIGQLCRQKKVPAKLIGRSWFVDLEYLKKYKQGVIDQNNFKLNKFTKINLDSSQKTPYIPNSFVSEQNVVNVPTLNSKLRGVYKYSFKNSLAFNFLTTLVVVFILSTTAFSWLSYLSPRHAENINGIIGAAYQNLSGIFGRRSSLALVGSSSEESPNQGIVVLPNAADSSQIQEIKNQFSDEVNVRFDEDAGTGVITPVFRSGQTGRDYAFIMVPVKSKK